MYHTISKLQSILHTAILFAVVVLLVLSSIAVYQSVAAQTVCGTHADIVKRLSSGYEERPRSAGIAANGNLVEVYSSDKGNWTIIFTKPGGMTCLMAVGENWQTIEGATVEGDPT